MRLMLEARPPAATGQTAEVVQEDDIARREGRGENRLDVEEESLAVDRPIDHSPKHINPLMAERGDQSLGLPMAVGRIGLQPSSLYPPAAHRHHVGLALHLWRAF
jgi:hypothetical protein